jgi:predicted nucleic acid-binding protein
MIRVVIDTNVVVSADIKTEGAEARVLDLVAARRAQLYISESILAEYQGVLTRPKRRLDPKRVQDALDPACVLPTCLAGMSSNRSSTLALILS